MGAGTRSEASTNRGPISGKVYSLLLGIFAPMPGAEAIEPGVLEKR